MVIARRAGLLVASLVACAFALALPAAAHARSQAPAPVVGAGAIAVPELAVRALPASRAPVVARLSEFREQDYRPRLVLAIDVLDSKSGKPAWYRIVIPGRPNGRTGWVRAGQVAIKPMPLQIVVRRESRRLELWRGRTRLFSTQVAVGAPGMETPLGIYHVTLRFTPRRQPFLGTFAFETSAYSKLSEWPGGGIVGIHGTTQPWLLGRAVSHGCIRISNEAADFLKRRVPVGTPIRIVRS
jgi:lipoprotein-anchoring transpeptidase ErfK/SrfK